MNYLLILKLIGNVFKIEAAFMIVPLAVSFIYGESVTNKTSFIWSILILVATGFALSLIKPKNKNFVPRDAFAATSLTWIFCSLLGALPFYFSGCFKSFTDCLFESVSGFTTTGATILAEIESLPKSILFWRSFTQWIGGMGILMFMVAVMPSMNASSVNLMRAEITGITPGKIVPKVRETAKIMYLIYFTLTVLLIIILTFTGLPVYDAFINGFSTAGTGGFSNMNASVGAYNNIAAEIVITVFMFLFGISFALYFYAIKGNLKSVFKDEELRFYGIIVVVAVVLITINITGLYQNIFEALRHSSFQVVSVISTTAFTTADYNMWPLLSRVIILILMFFGCCAGSTGGGVKLVRILVLIKTARAEIKKIIQPRNVKVITLNGKKIEDYAVSQTFVFFTVYFMIFLAATIIISIENKDITTTLASVITTLGNVGPALEEIGPVGNFGGFSVLSKLVLSVCMIIGRLEFFPMLILLRPSTWIMGKSGN